MPAEGGQFETHRDCGGAGCEGCCGSGYATLGRMALAALKARIVALAAGVRDPAELAAAEDAARDAYLAAPSAEPSRYRREASDHPARATPQPADPVRPGPSDHPPVQAAFAWD